MAGRGGFPPRDQGGPGRGARRGRSAWGGDKVGEQMAELRKKKERETHKLDWCLKFLVMGPIGPWTDTDDFMKNEFNDYVARSVTQI